MRHRLLSALRMNRPNLKISQGALTELATYDWPGNVRELQNAIERAIILSQGEPLRFDLPGPNTTSNAPRLSAQRSSKTDLLTRDEWKRQERNAIAAALQRSGGKAFGRGRRRRIASHESINPQFAHHGSEPQPNDNDLALAAETRKSGFRKEG